MKWLLTPILWLLAVGLAVLVVWRLWRGKPIMLRGRWSPHVIRMVAVVLVILGVGADRASSAPPVGKGLAPGSPEASPEPAPPFTLPMIEQWIYVFDRNSRWTLCKQQFTQVQLGGKLSPQTQENIRAHLRVAPPRLRKLMLADVDALAAGKVAEVVPVRELQLALAEAEKVGFFDLWLTAYIWRQAGRSDGDAEGRIELYRHLAEHSCMANALIKARPKGQQMLMAPRAWMSKAGPRPGQRIAHQTGLKEILKAANVHYTPGQLGIWTREGMAALSVDRESSSATLYAGGRKRAVEAGVAFRFHRLDLLQTPAGAKSVTLSHATYGKMTVPAGKLVSVWELPRYLSDDARKKVERDVEDALKGDEPAAARLEKALPLVHRRLREQLAALPNAIGAPRLRLILALFDDAVMPVPVTAVEEGRVIPAVGRRGR